MLVDGAGELSKALPPLLEARNFDVCIVSSALEALQIVVAAHFDVVVCDLKGFGLSRAAFQSALDRARMHLAGRCLFVSPSGVLVDSMDALLCGRPINFGEILRNVAFLASEPLAADDAVLTAADCQVPQSALPLARSAAG